MTGKRKRKNSAEVAADIAAQYQKEKEERERLAYESIKN